MKGNNKKIEKKNWKKKKKRKIIDKDKLFKTASCLLFVMDLVKL